MRLVTRLVASHAMLAAVLIGALALVLASLGDIYRQVRDVRERDLATIDEEEDLHRAAWAIEVAARHGIDNCENGLEESLVEQTFVAPKRVLEETIRLKGNAASKPIRDTVQRYVKLTEDLMRGDTCAHLRAPESRRQRLRLDEDLTNAWIARIYELHQRLEQKEDAIVQTGRRSILQGTAFAGVALLAAWLISAYVARGVTVPLSRLASAAERVGKGDFSPFPLVSGPHEVVELSGELDRMRARLAELDALKQQFLASVSHELRTPLGRMREALALLGDGTTGTLTAKQKSVVSIAQRACEAEIRLVATLLDLSRLRAGKLLRVESRQSIDDALREAIAVEETEAGSRGVRLAVESTGAAPLARLDGPMIERALANVIRNAVSVSKDGDTVEVTRIVEPSAKAPLAEPPSRKSGPWACVRVRDRGPGIPEEIRDIIFEPFTTKEVPGRQSRVGVGLGLAFAREVVRAHGGDVLLVDPSPGMATFEVWIPLADSLADESTDTRAQAHS